MAYSNYGAYVYKNSEDVTKKYCDKSFYYDTSLNEWRENPFDSEFKSVGSHAVIPINRTFCLEFYKNHTLNIHIKNQRIINIDVEKEIINKAIYKYKGIKIVGYYLDFEKSIIKFDINYKNDVYCIIIGSAFGNGWDKRITSKYIRKHIYYNYKERYFYISRFKNFFIDEYEVINCMRRRENIIDQIKHFKYCNSFKSILENLLQIWYLL